MSSKIEQLIDELEDYIDNCKPHAFSSSKIIVNREEIDELLRDLRMKTPDEIRRYQKMVSNKEAIINDAKEKADAIINDAAAKTNEMLSEQEIVQLANQRAQEIIDEANAQAQMILDDATNEANQLKAYAMQYTDGMLGNIESILSTSMDTCLAKFDSLNQSLKSCYDVVTANRAELYPAEPVQAPVEDELSQAIMAQAGEASGIDIL